MVWARLSGIHETWEDDLVNGLSQSKHFDWAKADTKLVCDNAREWEVKGEHISVVCLIMSQYLISLLLPWWSSLAKQTNALQSVKLWIAYVMFSVVFCCCHSVQNECYSPHPRYTTFSNSEKERTPLWQILNYQLYLPTDTKTAHFVICVR